MTHSSRRLCLALTLAFVTLGALAAPPARASDGSVGVVVDGEGTVLPQLVSHLENWLRTRGYDLVASPLQPEQISTLIDCVVVADTGCASKVVLKHSRSASVVLVRITVKAGSDALDRTVELRGYWLAKGADAFSVNQTCARCTDELFRTTASKLIEALAASASTRGRVQITSTPSGAKVTVDNKPLGETPIDYSLPFGNHSIYIQLDGWIPQRRPLAVQRGVPAALEVTLEQPRTHSKLLPISLIVAGGLAIAGGATLFALDEDKSPPEGRQEKDYFDSALGGVALGAAGVAAAGVGIFLYIHTAKKDGMPTVSLLPSGGGAVGWIGSF